MALTIKADSGDGLTGTVEFSATFDMAGVLGVKGETEAFVLAQAVAKARAAFQKEISAFSPAGLEQAKADAIAKVAAEFDEKMKRQPTVVMK